MSRSKAPSQRQLRVGEEIRHALSAVFMRGEIRDPVLANMSLTVTEVRASPDLRNATAFVVPLGGQATADRADVLKALKRVAPFLRGQVGKAIHLKFTPALSFQYDDSFEEASHIDDLLRSPEVARDLHHDDDEGDDSDYDDMRDEEE